MRQSKEEMKNEWEKEQVEVILDILETPAEKSRYKAQVRLHEIEMELDKTGPRENPPYRNKRRKLNREKIRLWDELYPNPTTSPQLIAERKEQVIPNNKKQVVKILQILKKKTSMGKKWEQNDYCEW